MNNIKNIKGLDSLYGSQTVVREGEGFYEIPDRVKEIMQRISEMTGDKIYLLDKGGTVLLKMYEANELEIEPIDEGGNIEVARYHDFNVYFVSSSTWFEFNGFINVKEVILPPEKDIEKNDIPRAYLLKSKSEFKKNIKVKDAKFYILPELNYPKSKFPDFLKFLKKQIKGFPKIDKVFDKNENPKNVYFFDIPKKNLKSIIDIRMYLSSISDKSYRKELIPIVGEKDADYMSNVGVELLKNGEPEILPVTQDMINKFLKEINNRYSVIR